MRQQTTKSGGCKRENSILTGMRKSSFPVEDMRGHHVALAVTLIFAEQLYYKNFIKSLSNPENKTCEKIRADSSTRTRGETMCCVRCSDRSANNVLTELIVGDRECNMVALSHILYRKLGFSPHTDK